MVSAHALGIACTAAMTFYTLPATQVDEILPVTTSASYYRLGNKLLTLNQIKTTDKASYTLVSLHPNEIQLRRTAREFLTNKPGKLISLDPSGERLMEAEVKDEKIVFDPARVLSFQARKSTLMENESWSRHNALTVQLFSNFLLNSLRDETAMVDLHNADGYPKFESFAQQAKGSGVVAVHKDEIMPSSNFIVTHHQELYKKFSDAGFNVVLVDSRKIADDGTLLSQGLRDGRTIVDLVANQQDDVNLMLMLEMADGVLR